MQDGATLSSPPETAVLRQEMAELKSVVNELKDRLEHYKQSNLEVNEDDAQSREEPYHREIERSPPRNQEIYIPYSKAHSDPTLSVSVHVVECGRISQSVQTLPFQVSRPQYVTTE